MHFSQKLILFAALGLLQVQSVLLNEEEIPSDAPNGDTMRTSQLQSSADIQEDAEEQEPEPSQLAEITVNQEVEVEEEEHTDQGQKLLSTGRTYFEEILHNLGNASSTYLIEAPARQPLVQLPTEKSDDETQLWEKFFQYYVQVPGQQRLAQTETTSLAQTQQEQTTTTIDVTALGRSVTPIDWIVAAFGAVFVIFIVGVLWRIEKRQVGIQSFYQSLAQTCQASVDGKADPNNDNKLVFVTGKTTNGDPIQDDLLDLTFKNAGKVKRKVEMLQYVIDKTTNKLSVEWSEEQLPNEGLEEDRQNPKNFPFKSEDFYSQTVTLGDFMLSKDHLQPLEGVKDKNAALIQNTEKLMVREGYTPFKAELSNYYSAPMIHLKQDQSVKDLMSTNFDKMNIDNALVGAIRVTFYRVMRVELNILGKQVKLGENYRIYSYNEKSVSFDEDQVDTGCFAGVDQILNSSDQQNHGINLAWKKEETGLTLEQKIQEQKEQLKSGNQLLLRIILFAILFAAFGIFFTPLSSVFSWLPWFNKILVGTGYNYFASGQAFAVILTTWSFFLILALCWLGTNNKLAGVSGLIFALFTILLFVLRA